MTSHAPCTTLTSTSLYEKEFVTTVSVRLISHTVSCTLVDRCQHVGETCCLHLHARKVKTMATYCFGRDTFHETMSLVLISQAVLFQQSEITGVLSQDPTVQLLVLSQSLVTFQ